MFNVAANGEQSAATHISRVEKGI